MVDQPPSDRQMGIKECIPVSSIVRLMRKLVKTIYNFKNENSRIFMDSMFPADVFICPRDSGGYDGTESRG